jgi:hypothetical protein
MHGRFCARRDAVALCVKEDDTLSRLLNFDELVPNDRVAPVLASPLQPANIKV